MHILLIGKHPFYSRKGKNKKASEKIINEDWTRHLPCSQYFYLT